MILALHLFSFSISKLTFDFELDGKNDIVSFDLHKNQFNYSTKLGLAIYRNTMCSAGPLQLCPDGVGVLTSNIQGLIYRWQQNTATGFVDNTIM